MCVCATTTFWLLKFTENFACLLYITKDVHEPFWDVLETVGNFWDEPRCNNHFCDIFEDAVKDFAIIPGAKSFLMYNDVFPTIEGDQLFFSHRLRCFWNDWKRLSHFSQNVWKSRLMNTNCETNDRNVSGKKSEVDSSLVHNWNYFFWPYDMWEKLSITA